MTKIARESRLNDKPQPARPIAPLILGMRADFRRSALYVPIGILPFAAAHWWFRDWFPPTGNSPVVSLIALAALVLLPVAVFRWRLRVDSSGIARRRLFGWDLWPWQLFEQGKVLEAEASPATFILPVKPFWARTLSLNLLEDSDRARVEAIIDRFHVRPALDLPEELALRCAFRKEAVITRGGLLLRDRGVETRYRWKETQALRIRRRDHRRRRLRDPQHRPPRSHCHLLNPPRQRQPDPVLVGNVRQRHPHCRSPRRRHRTLDSPRAHPDRLRERPVVHSVMTPAALINLLRSRALGIRAAATSFE